MKNIIIPCLLSLILTSNMAECQNVVSKEKLLKELKQKQILVPMWGWESETMAANAPKYGFEVVNQPQNSDTLQHNKDIPIWANAGLGMLVRPDLYSVRDPFDEEQIKNGFEVLRNVILFHERNNPTAVGYVIQWGMFGEGGFEWGYKFSEKAKIAFNKYMNTPGMDLPVKPAFGKPASMRYVKWIEFRTRTLTDFRARYLKFAKQFTKKLVGTWSEVYSVDNYVLNMGDAPGSDFVFYDLSFGDVTPYQNKAFGESHGEMETYSTFDAWLKHELPLMAKAAGEGVTPISFQFPMRKGYGEVQNLGAKKQYTVEHIEDEYSLKIGPYIKQLLDATANKNYPKEVALVYHSFQASALPGGENGKSDVMSIYYGSSKQIESSLHMMGANLEVIPYEWLNNHDLKKYKLIIVPDPMYLTKEMRQNLSKANNVLYAGEYLMAQRNINSESGDYLTEFKAQTILKSKSLKYFLNQSGEIKVNTAEKLMKDVDFGNNIYPADQMFKFEKLPSSSIVLASINDNPIILQYDKKNIFITNRVFSQAWNANDSWLENNLYNFLRNLLIKCKAEVKVISSPQMRANKFYEYGTYGITGNIAWNNANNEVELILKNSKKIIIPANGWIRIDNYTNN